MAWDVTDGTELWRRATLPGTTPIGVDHEVAVLERPEGWQVSVLTPATAAADLLRDWARVDILDVRTGESLTPALADAGVWSQRPSVCGPENDHFCILAVLESAPDVDAERLFQYSVTTPRLAEPEGAGFGYFDGGVSLTDRVSAGSDGQLRYGESGELRWSRPYEDLFGEGASTEASWAWLDAPDSPDAPLIGVGNITPSVERDQSSVWTSDAQTGTTVRLDRSTGNTIWSIRAQTCGLTDWDVRVTEGIVPLCRFTEGTVTVRWDGSRVTDVSHENVAAQLIGVDVATGAVTWELPLGEDGWRGPLDSGQALTYPSANGFIVAEVDDAVTIISLADGATYELAAAGEAVLCSQSPETVELVSPWVHNPYYEMQRRHAMCASDGEPIATQSIAVDALRIAGYDITEPMAIYTPRGLRVYAPVES